MAEKLPPVPYQARVVDDNGLLSPPWADWFKQLFARSGGHLATGDILTARLATDAVTFVKLLAADWASTQSTSGYQKLGSGLYIQWGVEASLASEGTDSVSFSVTFPTACLIGFVTIKDNSGVAKTATGQMGLGNYSTTGMDIYNRTSVAQVFNWLAVGH